MTTTPASNAAKMLGSIQLVCGTVSFAIAVGSFLNNHTIVCSASGRRKCTIADLTGHGVVNLLAGIVYCVTGSGLGACSGTIGKRGQMAIQSAISFVAVGQMGLSFDATTHDHHLPPVYMVGLIIIGTSIVMSSLLIFDCCCDGGEVNTTAGRVASDSTQYPTVFIVSNGRNYC